MRRWLLALSILVAVFMAALAPLTAEAGKARTKRMARVAAIYRAPVIEAGASYTESADSVWARIAAKSDKTCRVLLQTRRVLPDVTAWAPTYSGTADTAWTAAAAICEKTKLAGVALGTYETRYYVSDVVGTDTLVSGPFTMPLSAVSDDSVRVFLATGLIENGETVTITGANFGAKTTPAPVRYLDFEALTTGADLPAQASGGFTTSSVIAGCKPKVSIAHARGVQAKSAYQNFSTQGLYNGRLITNYNSTIAHTAWPASRIYISGWFYGSVTGSRLSRNYKRIQLRHGDLNSGAWDLRHDVYPLTSSGHSPVEGNLSGTVGPSYRDPASLYNTCQNWAFTSSVCAPAGLVDTGGAWHRYEVWFDQGTVEASDGYYEIRIDGKLWTYDTGAFYPNAESKFDYLLFSHYYATDDGAYPGPATQNVSALDMYWDEVYADTVRTRVELGNAATWPTCTRREVQPATSWASGSVAVTINQGEFDNGEIAYLYVVTSAGVVSNGLPIIVGAQMAQAGGGRKLYISELPE